MMISLVAVLFVASTSMTLVEAGNLRRSLPTQQRSLETGPFHYDQSMTCNLSFCQDFNTQCRITANPNNHDLPVQAASGPTSCRFTLARGVEIECDEKCDIEMEESLLIGYDPLPTGLVQIKRRDVSDNFCLEVAGFSKGGDVFQTECDPASSAQQWVLTEKLSEHNVPVFTLSPAIATGLCMDMERRPGRNMHLWDCKETGSNSFNQEFDTQFFYDTDGKFLTVQEKCVDVSLSLITGTSNNYNVFGDAAKSKDQCEISTSIPQFDLMS